MATYSKSVNSYRDVHLAFERAGIEGKLFLDFETPAKATTWCSRANAYRVLLRKLNQAEGREFASEFDHLMVRRKPGESRVVIEPRGFDFIARTPSGEVVEFDKATLDFPVPTPREKTRLLNEVDDFLKEFEKGEKK